MSPPEQSTILRLNSLSSSHLSITSLDFSSPPSRFLHRISSWIGWLLLEQVGDLDQIVLPILKALGLYGLITAKTYLEVAGAYDNDTKCNASDSFNSYIPPCFSTRPTAKDTRGRNLLVLDAASDIGGTWAEERLYPNLLSQNSYGLYEFSDLPLSVVVPEEKSGVGSQFIAGWKINKYLHAWVTKWKLRKHIKLNWKVSERSVTHFFLLTPRRSKASGVSRAKNGKSTSAAPRIQAMSSASPATS